MLSYRSKGRMDRQEERKTRERPDDITKPLLYAH
jgi:hypothetical protein